MFTPRHNPYRICDSWCRRHSLQLPSSCSMLKQTSSYLEGECRREESKATVTNRLGTRTGLDLRLVNSLDSPAEPQGLCCTSPWDEPRSEMSQEDIWISGSLDANLSPSFTSTTARVAIMSVVISTKPRRFRAGEHLPGNRHYSKCLLYLNLILPITWDGTVITNVYTLWGNWGSRGSSNLPKDSTASHKWLSWDSNSNSLTAVYINNHKNP